MLAHTLHLFEYGVQSGFNTVFLNANAKDKYVGRIGQAAAIGVCAKIRWVRGSAKFKQPRIEHHEGQPLDQYVPVGCERYAVA